MSFSKTVEVYERIPIDELTGHVSPTEIEICEVINLFIDELCLGAGDELRELGWDQILMTTSDTSDYSVMTVLLERITDELYGVTSDLDDWGRGSARRDILAANGYIFGDWRMKPYCAEALRSWVCAERDAIWKAELISKYPDVLEKENFNRELASFTAKRQTTIELLKARTGEGLSLALKRERFMIVMSAIESYGLSLEQFRLNTNLINKDGEKIKVVSIQLYDKCIELDEIGFMNISHDTWITEVWKKYKLLGY